MGACQHEPCRAGHALISKTFHVSLPARLSKVRELSSMVEAFGDANGLSQQRVFVMNLALDELIANT